MNYTVLVVDDEPLTRDFLAAAIPRSFLEFAQVRQARNGAEALDLLREQPCELLITDIRMPQMDGLELARQVQGLYAGMPVVILSGYDDFTYAQQAIRYGVRSYLLKPIENDKLEDMLGEMLALLEARRSAYHDDRHLREVADEYRQSLAGEYLEALYEGATSRKLAVAPLIKQLDITPFGKPRAVLSFVLDSESVLANSQSAADLETHDYVLYRALREMAMEWAVPAVYFDGGSHRVLLQAEDDNPKRFFEAVSQVLEQGAGLALVCGTSAPFTVEDAFRDSVRNADQLLAQGRLFGPGLYSEHDRELDKKVEALSSLSGTLYHAVSQRDIPAVGRAVAGYCARAQQLDITVQGYALGLLYPRPAELAPLFSTGANYSEALDTVLSVLQATASAHQIEKALAEAFTRLAHAKSVAGNAESSIVERACRFIQSRYGSPISLMDIAEDVGVSPNYLSALFSREIGESYIKYLTRVRMEAAAAMLRNGQGKKIAEVAEHCGFYNVKHFFRVFRLTYGMSPGEYQNANKG